MSGAWKLQQVRFLLDQSKLHKDDPRLFGDRVDDPLQQKDAYPFLVDATLNAMYGVVAHLKADYGKCTATDGRDWRAWYSERLGAVIGDKHTLLGFMLARGTGVRHVGTHQEPVLLSSSGERITEQSDDGDFIVHTNVDWFFQDMAFRAQREDAPAWVHPLARPVDEMLEDAYSQLREYVLEADKLFTHSWSQRLIDRMTRAKTS